MHFACEPPVTTDWVPVTVVQVHWGSAPCVPQEHSTEYFVVPQAQAPVASHDPPGLGGGLENVIGVHITASALEPASRSASDPPSRPVPIFPPHAERSRTKASDRPIEQNITNTPDRSASAGLPERSRSRTASSVPSRTSTPMKLAKGKTLWIAERRGAVVYVRAGKAGAKPIPRARELETEAAASAHLEAERAKRLLDGFRVVDENATLDEPFTLDGTIPAAKPPAAIPRAIAEQVHIMVAGGFLDADEIDAELDELVAAEDGAESLRARLDRLVTFERDALAAKKPPSPCVNEAIDAAFAELDANGIVALQSAGFTQSDGWEDADAIASERAKRGQKPRGACFYNLQTLESAVRGEGLWLTFGAYSGGSSKEADDRAIALAVVETLVKHGVPAEWNGETTSKVRILPFEWYRQPLR